MNLKEKLKIIVSQGNLEKAKKLLMLEAFDLGDLKVLEGATESKRAKLQPMSKKYQYELLSNAIDNKNLEMVKLDKGFELNFEDDDYSAKVPLLQMAIHSGNEIITKELIINGANVNSKTIEGHMFVNAGETALHYAIVKKQENIVKFLTEFGADLHVCDDISQTLMHVAAKYGNFEIVKYLCEHGTPFNDLNKYGYRPSDYAVTGLKSKEIFVYLLDRTTDNLNTIMETALGHAARKGQYEIVEILLNRGVNVNSKTHSYQALNAVEAPLHAVIRRPLPPDDVIRIVKALIERGADINMTDSKGNAPLHYAALKTDIKVAKLLLKHGADINLRNQEQMTPLLYAAKWGWPLLIKFLVFSGSDVFAKDYEDQNALDLVSSDYDRYGYPEKACILMKLLITMHSDSAEICGQWIRSITEYPKLLTFWNECLEEMRFIKQKINDTNVSLFDLLALKNSNQLAWLARNVSVKEALDKYPSEFKHFCVDLKEAYQLGECRKDLERGASLALWSLLLKSENLPSLPSVVTHEIVTFLDDADLNNLIQ